MRRLILAVAFMAAAPIHARAQNGWDDPFPAHQVMDNLYFVGTAGVASHGSFYDLPTKHEKLLHRMEGDPNPFIDHAGFLAYIDRREQSFQAMLETQQGSSR